MFYFCSQNTLFNFFNAYTKNRIFLTAQEVYTGVLSCLTHVIILGWLIFIWFQKKTNWNNHLHEALFFIILVNILSHC